jgi:hypothetical protein
MRRQRRRACARSMRVCRMYEFPTGFQGLAGLLPERADERIIRYFVMRPIRSSTRNLGIADVLLSF